MRKSVAIASIGLALLLALAPSAASAQETVFYKCTDAKGNVIKITNPDGGVNQFFDFNAFNQPQRSQDARGNWSLVRYDLKGNPTDDIRLKAGVVPTANTRPADADIVKTTRDSNCLDSPL